MAKNTERNVAIGVGMALAAAGAAAAYFLTGKKGAQRRKQIRGWMLKAKGEVLEKMEQAKDMNEELYSQIVEAVAKKYQAMKMVDAKELAEFNKEMRGHWRDIKKHIEPKKAKKATKKTAKKK